MQEAIVLLFKSGNSQDQIIDMLKLIFTQYRTQQSLHFYQVPMGATSLLPLSMALQDNISLHHLCLKNTFPNEAAILALAVALRVNGSLQSLDLSGNRLSGTVLLPLITALEVNISLHHLSLAYNELDDPAVQAIVRVLRVNRSLRSLGLNGNHMRSPTLQIIIEALRNNTSLRSLNLGCNFFKCSDIQMLANVLTENSTLHRLYLNDDCVDDTGLAALIEALLINRSLHILDIGDNQNISAYHLINIANLIEANRSLYRINLCGAFIALQPREHLYDLLHVQRNMRPLCLAFIIFKYMNKDPEIQHTFGLLPVELFLSVFNHCLTDRDLPDEPDYCRSFAQNKTNDEYLRGIWKTVERIWCKRNGCIPREPTNIPSIAFFAESHSRTLSRINTRRRKNIIVDAAAKSQTVMAPRLEL